MICEASHIKKADSVGEKGLYEEEGRGVIQWNIKWNMLPVHQAPQFLVPHYCIFGVSKSSESLGPTLYDMSYTAFWNNKLNTSSLLLLVIANFHNWKLFSSSSFNDFDANWLQKGPYIFQNLGLQWDWNDFMLIIMHRTAWSVLWITWLHDEGLKMSWGFGFWKQTLTNKVLKFKLLHNCSGVCHIFLFHSKY